MDWRSKKYRPNFYAEIKSQKIKTNIIAGLGEHFFAIQLDFYQMRNSQLHRPF
jgi:hypothetical protein